MQGHDTSEKAVAKSRDKTGANLRAATSFSGAVIAKIVRNGRRGAHDPVRLYMARQSAGSDDEERNWPPSWNKLPSGRSAPRVSRSVNITRARRRPTLISTHRNYLLAAVPTER